MGKMGDLGGNGEGRRRKSGGKEKIFLGEKFFIPPRSVRGYDGCDRGRAVDNVIWGARRRLVEGFMRFLIWSC